MWIKYKGSEYAVDLEDSESVSDFCALTGLQYFKETLGNQNIVFYNPEQYKVKKIACVPVLVFAGNTRTPEQPINASNYKMMFACNDALEYVDLTSWDYTGVMDIYRMFYNCVNLKQCHARFNGIHLMSSVFEDCESLEFVDTQDWVVNDTVDISRCFKGCKRLRMLDILNWDTSMLQSITELCYGCENLESFEAGNWITPNLQSAESGFEGCTRLKFVDMNKCSFDKAKNIQKIFAGCESMYYLACDKLESGFLPEKCKIKDAFLGCQSQIARELDKPRSIGKSIGLSVSNAF